MPLVRSSGVLLHVTSLPTPFGIGDLGPAAFQWVDMLAEAGQAWWQILPLGPMGGDHSPYQCYSAFAGSPLLISPERLVELGLLRRAQLSPYKLPGGPVQYERVSRAKLGLLTMAYDQFNARPSPDLSADFEAFGREQAAWLDDYALFAALHERHGTPDWTRWPGPLVRRQNKAMRQSRAELADAVRRHAFWQYLFARQLGALRDHARERGVRLIGDLPIFVSAHSADVWANPRLFELDRDLRPRAVAGVPPDLFCPDGQRWGNPLYDWRRMAEDGYAWWRARFRATLAQCDLVRLDHFRGFAGYWRVPAECPTAVDGRWVRGPGAAFLAALRDEAGGLPVIAEDLGVITPDVEKLRDDFALPGMRILEFAFGGDATNPHLPHNFSANCVAYTGTHDNDTLRGWLRTTSRTERDCLRAYGGTTDDPVWGVIRLAWTSVASIAIVPAQDLLSLGSAGRMNTPGTISRNWKWRLTNLSALRASLNELATLTTVTGRRVAPSDNNTATANSTDVAYS